MKNKSPLFLFVLILLAACNGGEPPAPYLYENKPEFTWSYADFYGNYYSNYNINTNVVTLNLFTKNLFINKKNELDGTGQYLIIEDIFISPSDTLLPAGKYSLAETGEHFTFFGGKKFEDNKETTPSGAYIYFIESDPAKSKIAYITGGDFTVNITNDSIYNIQGDFELDGKTNLKGTFKNVLYHLDRTVTTPSSVPRKKLELSKSVIY